MPGAGHFLTATRDEAVEHLLGGTSVDLMGQKSSGRSTLLSLIASQLVERGWDAVTVRAVATLKDRPLEALAIADLARRSDQRDASAIGAAVRRIEQAVADGRTVLVVDDVDDLDNASAGAITAAHARRAFPVLTTSRPRPDRVRDPFVLPSEVRPGVQLAVPTLGYVHVHALLGETLGGAVDAEVVARIATASGGLPGLVVAIATGAQRTHRLRFVNGAWQASGDLWSPGLTRAIQPLVADLAPPSLEALQLLSLVGSVGLPTAVDLVGWDVLEVIDSCGLLRIAPQGGQVVVGVYPPLIEDGYRHLPLATRRLRLVDRIVKAFDAAPGTDRPTARTRTLAAPWFQPEFEDASPSALRDESRPTETVLDRMLHDEWQREALLRRREWEHEPTAQTAAPYLRLLLVGNADVSLMRKVIERTPSPREPRDRAMLDRWVAQVLAHAEGDPGAAVALLRRRAREAGPWSGGLLALEQHLTLLYDRVPPAADGTVRQNRPDVAQFTGGVEAECLIAAGRAPEAADLLAQGGHWWTDRDLVTTRAVLVGLCRLVNGDPRQALAWSLQRLEQARAELDTDAIPGHAYVAVSSLLSLGRLGQARILLGTVLSTGLTSSLQRHYTSALLATAAGVAHADRLGGPAATLADQAATTATGPGPFFTPASLWPTSGLRIDSVGDAPAPWAHATNLFGLGFVLAGTIEAGAVLADDPDPRRVETLRAATGSEAAWLLEETVRVAEAGVDEDVMAGSRLAPELIEAGMVSLGVRALGSTIRRLRADGRAAEATALLVDARHLLQRAEAEPDALLDVLSPRADLSPREREIGRLVADGRTNGQIAASLGLTVKTVENHVNRLLRKLGISDRQAVGQALRG